MPSITDEPGSVHISFLTSTGGQLWKVSGVPRMPDEQAHDLAWAAVLKEYPKAELHYSSVIPSHWFKNRPEPDYARVIPYSDITDTPKP